MDSFCANKKLCQYKHLSSVILRPKEIVLLLPLMHPEHSNLIKIVLIFVVPRSILAIVMMLFIKKLHTISMIFYILNKKVSMFCDLFKSLFALFTVVYYSIIQTKVTCSVLDLCTPIRTRESYDQRKTLPPMVQHPRNRRQVR